MSQANILVIFSNSSAMIYEPTWSVRIANRGPSEVRKKDYEQVQRHPPLWFGFNDFEARILTAGHRVLSHRGLMTVERVERAVDASPGDAAEVLQGK